MGMMGEGGPHSPDSEGGVAATSEEGAESGKGAKNEEGGESGDSVRRRPPLKRQITRNQSDPKILPVKIFLSDETKSNRSWLLLQDLSDIFNLWRKKLSKY